MQELTSLLSEAVEELRRVSRSNISQCLPVLPDTEIAAFWPPASRPVVLELCELHRRSLLPNSQVEPESQTEQNSQESFLPNRQTLEP